MSFFERMAARAIGTQAPLRARTPQRYEAVPPTPAVAPPDVTAAPAPGPPEDLLRERSPAESAPARGLAAVRPGLQPRDGDSAPRRPDHRSDSRAAAGPAAPASTTGTPAPVRGTAPRAPDRTTPERPTPEPAASAARAHAADRDPDSPTGSDRSGAMGPRPSGPPHDDHGAALRASVGRAVLPSAPLRPSAPPSRPSAPPPPAVRPPLGQRPAQRAGPRPTPRAATPPPDLGEILRDHVVPALVRGGDVTPRERPGLVLPRSPAAPPAPPAPGTLTVVAGQVDVRHGEEPDAPRARTPGAAAPQTSVHIDRVVVTRAPAPVPPPAPPAPRQRPRVDHQAYLARRRDQR